MWAHSAAAWLSRTNGGVPGQAVVEQAREHVRVGRRADLLAADLLRGEVVERADPLPRVRQAADADALGDPEVGEVGVLGLVGGEQHVGRLDVAVHEAAGVGRVERGGDLGDQPRRSPRLQRSGVGEHLLEIDAVDEAHRDEQQPVVLARLVHGDHVGVLDRGRDPRLGLEAFAEVGVLGVVGGDQLDRHRTVQRQLGGAVDDPHSAAGDRAPRSDSRR